MDFITKYFKFSGDGNDIALVEDDKAILECDLDNSTEFIIEGQNVQENIWGAVPKEIKNFKQI